MPLYEYQCLTCDHTFDAIQKFSDDPLSECPECGKAVRKCVSTPAIQFKGSGFYITDYTKRGTSSSAEKAGSGKKEGGADKKPAAEKKKAAPKAEKKK